MNNFLLGFGIGITVGVLFAPKAGPETREYLSNKAAEGSDYLMQQGQQLRDTASDLVDRGRKILNDQKETISNVANSAMQAAKQQTNQPVQA